MTVPSFNLPARSSVLRTRLGSLKLVHYQPNMGLYKHLFLPSTAAEWKD